MCGIVGYVGYDKATPLLLQGLERLEYRGYDSAGIAIISDKKIETTKSNGKLEQLKKNIEKAPEFNSHIGIGHTRWATHGVPSIKNAHPICSKSNKFSVVHNGIIENYMELKEMLGKNGFEFNSDTDTEVIVQLAEFLYDGDFFSTIRKVEEKLEGSYAFAILCEDFPDQIIAVKNSNPLVIGLGESGNFLASDVTAMAHMTRRVIRLNDGETAVIKRDGVKIFGDNAQEVAAEPFLVDWDISVSEKNGYNHFMLKEIFEQAEVVKKTIEPRIKNSAISIENINFSREYLEKLSKIYIIGCGSAYHVGCVAKYVFEKLVKKTTEIEIASEFRYKSPIIDEHTLTIVISQSGETADTLAALREAKKSGAKVLSIVNVVGSSIANESDSVIYTWAGPEIAVATTKAYSTQLSVIYLLAIYMAKILGNIDKNECEYFIDELKKLPKKIDFILENETNLKNLAESFKDCKNIFFIGRNVDYAVALEGALKSKEISYIHSEAYAAGELKHGTISLVENGTLVIAIATQESLFEKMISNVKEVKARGATVVLITTEKFKEYGKIADYEVYIPETCGIMHASLSVIPLQLFSYYIALAKGCDIDKPRNLAKSVTVE